MMNREGRLNHNGYIEVYKPNHHRSRGNGYVFEHILIAEKTFNRKLTSEEIVHHINEIKTDNSPSNLEILTRGEHTTRHRKGIRTGSYKKCETCGSYFYRKPSHVKRARFCSNKCNGMSSDIGELNCKGITRDKLINVLSENKGNTILAAKDLKVHRSSIYKNIKKYGVDKHEYE